MNADNEKKSSGPRATASQGTRSKEGGPAGSPYYLSAPKIAGLPQTDVLPTLVALATREDPQLDDLDGFSFVDSIHDAESTSRHRKQYYEMDGNRGMYVDGWELNNITTDPTQIDDLSSVEVERTAAMAAEWEDTAWEKQVFPLVDDSDLKDPVSPTERRASRPIEILRGAQTLDRFRSRVLVQMRSFDVRVQFTDGYQSTDEGVLIAHDDQAGGYLLYVEDGDLHFCHNYGGRTRDFKMGALGQNLECIDLAFVAQAEGGCSVHIEVHGERREVPAQFNLFTGATPFQGVDVGIDRRSPVSRKLRSRRGTFAYAGALCSVTITPGQRLSKLLQSSQSNVDEEHNRLAERLDD